jgi:hypothetical protein
MPCFDEQALCAAQVWTQVPQWFRDGVSSCLMKDAGFTVRANLGSATGVMGNPFTVRDLPGRLTRTTASVRVMETGGARTGAGISPSIPSQTSMATSKPREEEMSIGAKAGFGVGIGLGVILIAVAAFLLVRSRRRPIPIEDAEMKRAMSPAELHSTMAPAELHDAHIKEIAGDAVYPRNEMPGSLAPRFELGVRASTWMAELPSARSMRSSRARS